MVMYVKLHYIIMDKKLTNFMKIWSLQNKQTYPSLQTFTDNTVTHKHTLKLASLKRIN